MKLSLAWIFDHIKASWKDVDVTKLIAQFGSITAEVEDVKHIQLDLTAITLAKILSITSLGIVAESAEFKKKFSLPERAGIEPGHYYLVKKAGRSYRWCTLGDIGSEKEGLVPQLSRADSMVNGLWKEHFESEDFIITIDNKSFTHRPDMWGHRGFAREMAAILQVELLPEEIFLASKPIKHYKTTAPVSSTNPFTIGLETNQVECEHACKRLAAVYITHIINQPSLIPIAHRLARIDARPIDMLVDATNYVMFDLGQPVHAFDAEKIGTHTLLGRCAYKGEELKLLDGQEIILESSDYVITDGQKPIALAGIMGGQPTAVTEHTTKVLLDSANYDPTTIRKTCARLKLRTEASARFEKGLDPNQNTQAILRFLKLLETTNIQYKASDAIASIGPLVDESIIIVEHSFITSRIGSSISPEKIQDYLIALGFGVQLHQGVSSSKLAPGIHYHLTVPTYRGNDVTIAEDIVEEIARFVGYNTINQSFAQRSMQPFSTSSIEKTRAIKGSMAFSLAMHEVQTYALYDEEFLHLLDWQPKDAISLANPFTQNMQRLVTSLVPNLLKCVTTNKAKAESLRFFELDRVWFQESKIVERKELAGILFEQKKIIDFYDMKAELSKLFTMLCIEIDWKKPSQQLDSWYTAHQTAELMYHERIVGTAGMIDQTFLHKIAEGNAFIFELDADFLLSFKAAVHQYEQLPKYQEVHLDISMLVPKGVTVAELEHVIAASDQTIRHVELIDFYEKEEWHDKKSITMRFTVYDEHKTMVKSEIDAVWNKVLKRVEKMGAQVR